MAKSYRMQLVCPRMDYAKWIVLESVPISKEEIENTFYELDCPNHGLQRVKPLQAEEKRHFVRRRKKAKVT